MIARWEARLRALRRRASRSEWLVRLLGLPRSPATAAEPGLVMVQIDGLSQEQLERAIAAGRMPFLKSLLTHQRYRVHTFYSGLPSSTPGVQGELFYGVPTAVPAFSYRRSSDGELVRMYDGPAAAHVQHLLESQDSGLLAGGSAYCDIYDGGARHSHFCPATMGWDEVVRAIHPLALCGALLWHGASILRLAALLVIEFFLAVADMLRGVAGREDLWTELKFVPTRVGINIGLRELIVIGASMDVTRGLPIVHCNLLGYDEQAHRRGPSSAFAHWTLKGIDDAVARIARAAWRSACRDYDVWVYADHGQEATTPYPTLTGQTIQEAMARVLGKQAPNRHRRRARGEQFGRARWLGGRRLPGVLRQPPADELHSTEAMVAAMGPVAHVYPQAAFELAEIERLARLLVLEAQVPTVFVALPEARVAVFDRRGRFTLPEQAGAVFGDDHPFLAEVTRDTLAWVHHPDAGALVLCGWQRGGPNVSFPMENGAHCGPGPEETRAFALLPRDAPLPRFDGYLRPLDLRAAALHRLGRAPHPDPSYRAPPTTAPRTLRILTYNVHSCIGMDGKLSPARIARVIAQCEPDVVALQELDVRRRRTDLCDQAEEIARELKMEFHFHPALRLEEELYGDAVLCRYPMRLVRAAGLPGLASRPRLEPRGAIWVAIDLGNGRELQLINTHLGLVSAERRRQVEALLGDLWLADSRCGQPRVLCGDFNALPGTRSYRRLARALRDAQHELDGHRAHRTWFSAYPLGRIDHVFVDGPLEVVGVEVLRTQLARVASDHLPLLVEVRLEA